MTSSATRNKSGGTPLSGTKTARFRGERNTRTEKAANWDLRTVPDRICSAGGIGHSSAHHQRSIAAAESAAKRQRPLGTLLLRRIAAERNHDAGHLHGVRYAKTWILPRWGNMRLEQVKTVEVERWLRTVDRANGTKAKIKTVMSAIFSHAVRWEFNGLICQTKCLAGSGAV
jgi:hypothetical protein